MLNEPLLAFFKAILVWFYCSYSQMNKYNIIMEALTFSEVSNNFCEQQSTDQSAHPCSLFSAVIIRCVNNRDVYLLYKKCRTLARPFC